MKSTTRVLCLFAVLLYVGCSTAQPPKAAATEAPSVSSNDPAIPRCKSLYEQNCQSCHKLEDPKSHSTERWNKVMPIMASKAKIDMPTADSIMKYIMAARTVGITPTPMK